jgi:hypothetical protein
VQDLGSLLPGDPVSALVPTSQHAGNQVWSQEHAMTAPGGASGDLGNDLGQAVVVHPPDVETGEKITPGTSGKPPAKAGSLSAGPPSWTRTTTPDVVRDS